MDPPKLELVFAGTTQSVLWSLLNNNKWSVFLDHFVSGAKFSDSLKKQSIAERASHFSVHSKETTGALHLPYLGIKTLFF